MIKLIRHARQAEQGFTLIELVVVIAILGVMAAIAVPMVNNFLASSKEQAWIADRATIQASVDAYYSSPGNIRHLGFRQYPIIGASKLNGTFILAARGEGEIGPRDLTGLGNPLGGTRGGEPKWTDGGNGVRDSDEEAILDNDEDGLDAPGWHVATVARETTDYIVDSRDYFIDFIPLVEKGLLEKAPPSASTDNGGGTASGSYSWYVDPNGRVSSIYTFFPVATETGFRDVYP